MFIAYPDPRLHEKAPPAYVNDLAVQDVGTRLLEAAKASKAYGLAAAHIGEVVAVIVVNVAPKASRPEYLLMYNPRVTAHAAEMENGAEASVSLEGIEVDIVRHQWVDVQFDDFKGQPRQLQFEGFVARCVQHEIDQMNGMFFLQKLSKLKRDMVLKKYQKLRKNS